MSTTLIRTPPDFQTFLRPCYVLHLFSIYPQLRPKLTSWYLLIKKPQNFSNPWMIPLSCTFDNSIGPIRNIKTKGFLECGITSDKVKLTRMLSNL